MLTYTMLLTALPNACLFLFILPLTFALFIQMLFVHMLCLWVVDTVCYFNYYIASCTVLLISWFYKFYVHTVFVHEKTMCSEEIALNNNHYYYY